MREKLIELVDKLKAMEAESASTARNPARVLAERNTAAGSRVACRFAIRELEKILKEANSGS